MIFSLPKAVYDSLTYHAIDFLHIKDIVHLQWQELKKTKRKDTPPALVNKESFLEIKACQKCKKRVGNPKTNGLCPQCRSGKVA